MAAVRVYFIYFINAGGRKALALYLIYLYYIMFIKSKYTQHCVYPKFNLIYIIILSLFF